MLLALDAGNTNIVIGCCDGDKIIFTERIATNQSATELEYAMVFKNITEIYGVDISSVNAAVVSSVVPNITNILRDAIKMLFKCDPIIIGPGIKTGLKIVYNNPAQLGADLVVDAVAGIKEYGAPLIIIDMGTATTISAIGTDGSYLGTVIMPGTLVSLNSLVGGTSQLPKIPLEKPKSVIGTNTVECMKSGIMHGTAASIDGMIDKIRAEMGTDARVIATGGLARSIIPLCEKEITVDDELLLKGLMEIYRKNSQD